MDDRPKGISNSEVREYALASVQKPQSSFSTVLAALAIIIPAAGVYFWRTGALSGISTGGVFSSFGQSIPSAPTASNQRGTSGGISAQAMRDPRSDLGTALKMQMNMDVFFEFVGEQMNMASSMMSNEPQKWISSDRLVEHCKHIARMQVMDRGHAYRENGIEMYNLMGERMICLLSKRPEKLCDPETKAEVVRQYSMYHKVKHGALDFLGLGNAQAAAMLNTGPHLAVKAELAKLGTRGYLQSSDFGYFFKPEDVKEVFANIKDVKSACPG